MIQGILHPQIQDGWPWKADVWSTVFNWLLRLDPKVENGRYELQSFNMFATIMEYDTIPRNLAKFESHQEFVDLHYTLAGQEEIDWHPVAGLTPAGPFEEDLQFWLNPTHGWGTLAQIPGRFAVFLTDDAHRPKVSSGSKSVKKVVVKIHRTHLLV